MSQSKPTNLQKNIDLRSPTGTILYLENIKSLRSVQINDTGDADNLFKVDIVDVDGVFRQDYTCSYDCLGLICAMLYSEGDSEDKTIITISFEAFVNAVTMSRNAGYTDAAKGLLEDDYEEDAMEEYMNRETNVTLN
jgi:hypothetical protein